MNNVSDEKNRGITHLSKVSLCIPFVYLLNLTGEVPTFCGFHLLFLFFPFVFQFYRFWNPAELFNNKAARELTRLKNVNELDNEKKKV